MQHIVASWRPAPGIALGNALFLGGKAVGLMGLPQKWTPPFIIFTQRFYEEWQEKRASGALRQLPPQDLQVLQEFLELSTASSRRVLVRSNSPIEGSTTVSGAYPSIPVTPDITRIAEAMDVICASGAPRPVYVLVQQCIEPAVFGHMSNERRVSSRRSDWLVEGLSSFGPVKVRTRQSSDAEERELLASTEEKVLAVLAMVAAKLAAKEQGYFHCEWVWTGKQVWIVQADPRAPRRTSEAANTYILSQTPKGLRFSGTPSVLRHFNDLRERRWKKLRRPIEFHELGLPVADIYVLPGDEWAEAKGHADLISDLKAMCAEPVVVRCDIASDVPAEDVFLPTSRPTVNTEELMKFMDDAAQQFHQKGIAQGDWAFLLAQIVWARASAMIHARPEGHMIQIDALWGFPDGLLHFPHDTYFYSRTEETITRKPRYKGYCLMCKVDEWATMPVDPPLDWGCVLSDAEINTLARWGIRLADALGSEVQLMALARINATRGAQGCLPWHYTQLKVPTRARTRKVALVSDRVHVIHSMSDFSRIKALDGVRWKDGIMIRPEVGALRDSDFLGQVAGFACEVGAPIYFEGSLLGHAYYIMSSKGAKVIPVSESRSPLDVKRYHKLVRDTIPAIISRSGSVARVRNLSKGEAMVLLAQKLLEEAHEVWQSDSSHLAGELADVLEVVAALAEGNGISPEDLDQIRTNKRAQRGGFENLLFLEETASRSLDVDEEIPGTLPLILDNDSSRSVQPLPRSRGPEMPLMRASLNERGRELEFTTPLIPPVKRGYKMRSLSCRVGDYEVVVTYDKAQLTATIRRAVVSPSPNQLRLFPGLEPHTHGP